ncbi:vam6 Vps39 [Olea europaea subsp. europaea]|uniref:Vam6 Vps39 n=1 Tax=Olea europaea subsp. europaea TaxID=158383 RepID=A0A8S0RME6_OLEEU|nr:vam6 Vps39 [Olea europaea subsp. europaea]
MSWCGENICVGIRTEYTILNATNDALSEVFSSGRIAPNLAVSLPYGELLLGKNFINAVHHEALKLLHKLVEDSNSDHPLPELTQKFRPEMLIEYLKPLCGTDPVLVLEFSMLVLESSNLNY